MREIKFRAWAYASKVIFYPDSDEGWELKNGVITPLFNTMLMQFTGLHDKNGKEIYDADVMLWPDEYKQIIGFNEKHTETSVRDIEKSQKLYDYMDVHFGYHFDSQHPVEQGEVIGNIYENPELVRS